MCQPRKGGPAPFIQGWSGLIWFLLARLLSTLSCCGCMLRTWQCFVVDYYILLWLALDQSRGSKSSMMLHRLDEKAFKEIREAGASTASHAEEVTPVTAKQHFPSHAYTSTAVTENNSVFHRFLLCKTHTNIKKKKSQTMTCVKCDACQIASRRGQHPWEWSRGRKLQRPVKQNKKKGWMVVKYDLQCYIVTTALIIYNNTRGALSDCWKINMSVHDFNCWAVECLTCNQMTHSKTNCRCVWWKWTGWNAGNEHQDLISSYLLPVAE